jgi:hypothetical protein
MAMSRLSIWFIKRISKMTKLGTPAPLKGIYDQWTEAAEQFAKDGRFVPLIMAAVIAGQSLGLHYDNVGQSRSKVADTADASGIDFLELAVHGKALQGATNQLFSEMSQLLQAKSGPFEPILRDGFGQVGDADAVEKNSLLRLVKMIETSITDFNKLRLATGEGDEIPALPDNATARGVQAKIAAMAPAPRG